MNEESTSKAAAEVNQQWLKDNADKVVKMDDKKTDPWKHRSKGMKCESCMWFILKIGSIESIGRCRRHAPTMSGYPVVFSTDWCGDHKLTEHKL